VVICSVHWVC